MTAFQEQFQRDAMACESVLKQLLASNVGCSASRLREAMEYGLLNGGKRLRASLVLAAARMVTGDIKGVCAVWRTHKGMTPVC